MGKGIFSQASIDRSQSPVILIGLRKHKASAGFKVLRAVTEEYYGLGCHAV
jgi:hypothetical protein